MSEKCESQVFDDGASSRRSFVRGAASVSGLSATSGCLNLGLFGSSESQSSDGIPTPWLHVDGNRIKDPEGNEVILRGICTADPKRINTTSSERGKNTGQVIDLATDPNRGWYSRVIHLPVHPADIGGHPKGESATPISFSQDELDIYLEEHLDPAVKQCRENGVYCIVDYHRHRRNHWTDPDLDKEIRLFWETVAPRYSDQSHVLYELFKEPAIPGFGDMEEIWSKYRETAQPWVDLIREHAPKNLLLIGSPRWSQFPQGAVRYGEFEGTNLVYTLTVYPSHVWQGEKVELDEFTDRAWEEIPLFVTEWGYQPDGDRALYRGTTDGYGEMMRDWFSDRPVHWTAWCFDPWWVPKMFEQDSDSGDWRLLEGDFQGKFIKELLAKHRDEDIPRPTK